MAVRPRPAAGGAGRVLELGCGPLGGFVPALRGAGYAAVGIDPQAPDEPDYHRIGFEDDRPPQLGDFDAAEEVVQD